MWSKTRGILDWTIAILYIIDRFCSFNPSRHFTFQSAKCSRPQIEDLAGCMRVPSLPTEKDKKTCRCKDGPGFNDRITDAIKSKKRRRKACCLAIHLCEKVRQCGLWLRRFSQLPKLK